MYFSLLNSLSCGSNWSLILKKSWKCINCILTYSRHYTFVIVTFRHFAFNVTPFISWLCEITVSNAFSEVGFG